MVVSWVTSPMATWSALIALLSVHLATNYAAVKAVSMHSLNRQRANIVLSTILQEGRVISPAEVSTKERIFEKDGVLRWSDDSIIGHCRIGVTFQTMLSCIRQRHKRTGSLELPAVKMSDLVRLYQHEAFLLWWTGSDAVIVLKQGCTALDQLKAWTQALLLAGRGRVEVEHQLRDDASGERLAELRFALEETRKLFGTYETKLREAGWDLDVAVLETRAGSRIEMDAIKLT